MKSKGEHTNVINTFPCQEIRHKAPLQPPRSWQAEREDERDGTIESIATLKPQTENKCHAILAMQVTDVQQILQV